MEINPVLFRYDILSKHFSILLTIAKVYIYCGYIDNLDKLIVFRISTAQYSQKFYSQKMIAYNLNTDI